MHALSVVRRDMSVSAAGEDAAVCLAVAILQACFACCNLGLGAAELKASDDGNSPLPAPHTSAADSGILLRPESHLQALIQHVDCDKAKAVDSDASEVHANGDMHASEDGLANPAAQQSSQVRLAAVGLDVMAAARMHERNNKPCAFCQALASGGQDHKLNARRWLAFVSQHHMSARPSRPMLKQVSTFFYELGSRGCIW